MSADKPLHIKYKPATLSECITYKAVSKAKKLIDAGEKDIFIEGNTGSGKTTLMALLVKEYFSDHKLLIIDNESILNIHKLKKLNKETKVIVLADDVDLLTNKNINSLAYCIKKLKDNKSIVFIVTAKYVYNRAMRDIKSVCHNYIKMEKVSLVNITDMLNKIALQENIDIDKKVLNKIAKLSNYNLRKALMLLSEAYHSIVGTITLRKFEELHGGIINGRA